MSDYVIYTDSACDVSPELLKQWGVYCSSLTFRFDGEETEYTNETMPSAEFFAKMRAGGIAKTAAVNVSTFITDFEKLLQQGKDILYLGMSSTFSATYQSAVMAAQQLRERYPQRKILTVDTLCACAGQALLVYLTLEKKQSGATIEEAADFAEKQKLRICHWITVDDLIYLKRGGRLSPTVTLVGKALGMKPILCVNKDGKLESNSKVRGRKKAIAALADKYREFADDMENGVTFIFHGECREAAETLATILKEKHHVAKTMISEMTAVVGAHLGPGTLFLSFVGNGR